MWVYEFFHSQCLSQHVWVSVRHLPLHLFLLFHLLQLGEVVNLLHLCLRVLVEHVRLPLPLNRLFRTVYSVSASFYSLPPELVSHCRQNGFYLLWFFVAKRNVFDVAVDVGSTEEGVIISLTDEVKVDVFVVVHEAFKLIGGDGIPDSCGAAAEITEEDGQFSQLEDAPTAHLATI